MNKPENVPIATLSGIASLTDIACELSLPSSASTTKDAVIFNNNQDASEATLFIQQPQNQNQLISFTQLLSSVNNAYLDFKNSSYNRPSHFSDLSALPPVLQQVLFHRPDVFQPHFDTYHGSPLKQNTRMSAYSPNQRHSFLLQQQMQQHVINPSPLGTQYSSDPSSPMKSPHIQQFLKANNLSHSPQIAYNMASPKLPQHQHQQQHQEHQQQRQQEENPPELNHFQFYSPLKTRGQRQSTDTIEVPSVTPAQINKPDDVRKNLTELQSFEAQPNDTPAALDEKLKEKRTHHKKKRKSRDHQLSNSSHNENTQVLNNDIEAKVPPDDTGQLYLKKKPAYKLDQQNSCDANTNIVELHKQANEGPKLELRVPKLIVRKVKRKEGNNEIETLEVYSPDKPDVKIYRTPSIEVNSFDYQDVRKSKRTRSKASSVSSSESSIKARKRKKITQVETSSDEEENETTVNLTNQAMKKYKYNEFNDVEGVEVKAIVKKFVFIMDKILDRELELEADGDLDFNDDVEIPPETLLPGPLISSLCSELAKMKSSGLLNEIPTDQLVRIISVMDRHVRDTLHLVISMDEDGEESKKWYSIQAERIIRSGEAATAILHITTTPGMPKQVFLEEAIEHIASLCQFQLENTIYPEFDPIYKVPSDMKDSAFLPKSKRGRSTGTKNKFALQIYNKFCEVVSLLADLIALESLTDSIILKMSQIGIAPFFVEQINILQLEALKVARTIFRNYVKHRDLIMDDILASIARLPSSKRSLRSYRLQENVCIQMFTALVLQLVQCTVQIPEIETTDSQGDSLVDKDVLIVKSYEDALRAARNFMSVFLKKCSANARDENDFRPLFENFLHDLFTMSNLPEWPAAEVLLTQLGRLFVVTFSNSKIDMSLRSSALDYLSQITTHLRKFALKNQADGEQEKLKVIVEKLINTRNNEHVPVTDDMEVYDEKLRKSLLMYLQSCSDDDPSFKYAREFYLGLWIRDVQIEIEKSMIAPMLSIPGAATKADNDDDDDDDEDAKQSKEELSADKQQVLQERKDFYHSLIKEKSVSTLKSVQPLNYESACVVIDYLASTRSFSQSFDIYMHQIFKMLSEQAIGLRTKAVKALIMIVSVDSNILAREDVQASVHGRLLDPSTNVREAAVDLIGQFILKCPNLIKQYYDMIIARILDTGISVRKRVIKILRDICIEHPEFEKIPEICATMVRRVDDEIGIKKLVTDVFRTMWFQPIGDVNRQSNILYHKAVNITKVVSLCKDTGYDWLESLLSNLLDPENQLSKTNTISACQQLVDCLFHRLLKPELKSDATTIVSCLITLYLFCKSYPNLLIPHAMTLQPYLSSKVDSRTDRVVIQQVSKILELVIPLMEHPNPKFLAELEEDTMKLILQQSQNVVQSCASCLSAIINKVTHNYKFVVDGFNQLLKFLRFYRERHRKSPDHPAMKAKKPTLLRALFTIGLFIRYFDLDAHFTEDVADKTPISEQVFDLCMYFTDFKDEEIAIKAIVAIGFIGIRYPKLLLRDDCRNLYQEVLSPSSNSMKVKYTVMRSLHSHLMEEENRMQLAEKNNTVVKKKTKKEKEKFTDKHESIKEFGDALSGITSEIIQVFLTDIMKGFFHAEKQIRTSALQVITIVLRQGLVHPAQCIPYLVAISTDDEPLCHIKAEQCLNDLDSRYQGFIHMKAFLGVKMAYQIQTTVQMNNGGYLCGYRENENKEALISHVYGLVRSNKQYRRSFLVSILKQFDDKKASVDLLYFLTENMAYLNYNTPEEPLFIINHIDTSVSVTGANVLQNFKELFHPKEKSGKSPNNMDESDDDDDATNINSQELKIDEDVLTKVVRQSFGCVMLLELKQYLKTIFGFTDSKCQKYSPTEPSKLYDKALNRKCNMDFTTGYKEILFSSKMEYEQMTEHYLKFKEMMMSLDTEDDSDSESPEKSEDVPVVSDVKVVVEDELNVDQSVVKAEESTGVIPQPMNSTLPGLNININIPVIPAHIYKEEPKKRRSGSRRSSRSSRGSMTHDV